MKTEQLIRLLAAGAGPAPRALAARRLAPVLTASLLVSAVASVAALGLIPSTMWAGSALWIKLAYAAGLGASCAWLAARLGQPAAPIGMAAYTPIWVLATMLVASAAELAVAAPSDRLSHLLGHSAVRCPWAIVVLSLPGLFGIVWALRGLAPTRLRLTGLAAGLLAGATGAAGYALSCTEESTAFVAVWYSLGIALSGTLGCALGRRLLRW